jgi:hypothetical protein
MFESVFPSPELRRLVEAQLATSIRAAHSVNPNGWGVTLFAAGGAYLRLNVSLLETLVIYPRPEGRVALLVRHKSLTKQVRERLREKKGPLLDWGSHYPSERDARRVLIAESEIAEWMPLLSEAHIDMVRLAASHVRTKSGWAKYHSPGVIEYLQEIGLEVPAPGYSVGAAREESGE